MRTMTGLLRDRLAITDAIKDRWIEVHSNIEMGLRTGPELAARANVSVELAFSAALSHGLRLRWSNQDAGGRWVDGYESYAKKIPAAEWDAAIGACVTNAELGLIFGVSRESARVWKKAREAA